MAADTEYRTWGELAGPADGPDEGSASAALADWRAARQAEPPAPAQFYMRMHAPDGTPPRPWSGLPPRPQRSVSPGGSDPPVPSTYGGGGSGTSSRGARAASGSALGVARALSMNVAPQLLDSPLSAPLARASGGTGVGSGRPPSAHSYVSLSQPSFGSSHEPSAARPLSGHSPAGGPAGSAQLRPTAMAPSAYVPAQREHASAEAISAAQQQHVLAAIAEVAEALVARFPDRFPTFEAAVSAAVEQSPMLRLGANALRTAFKGGRESPGLAEAGSSDRRQFSGRSGRPAGSAGPSGRSSDRLGHSMPAGGRRPNSPGPAAEAQRPASASQSGKWGPDGPAAGGPRSILRGRPASAAATMASQPASNSEDLHASSGGGHSSSGADSPRVKFLPVSAMSLGSMLRHSPPSSAAEKTHRPLSAFALQSKAADDRKLLADMRATYFGQNVHPAQTPAEMQRAKEARDAENESRRAKPPSKMHQMLAMESFNERAAQMNTHRGRRARQLLADARKSSLDSTPPSTDRSGGSTARAASSAAAGSSGSGAAGAGAPAAAAGPSKSKPRQTFWHKDFQMVAQANESTFVHPAEDPSVHGSESLAVRKPWRVTANDEALISWMKSRGRLMRRRQRLEETRLDDDMKYLGWLAARMRRRQRLMEMEEVAAQNAAAAKIQAMWHTRKGGKNNAPGKSQAQINASEAMLTKFDAFCQSEYPALPFLPTLPVVICYYARYLNTEQRLTDIKDLAPHFDAINQAHRDSDLDMPCLSPCDTGAYLFAIRKRSDAVRPPPERRAPLHPRFVMKMMDLAINSRDERVRRACAFTVLSYSCLGRPSGPNYSTRLEDIALETDGTVRMYEREPGAAFRNKKGFAMVYPLKVWKGGAAAELEARRAAVGLHSLKPPSRSAAATKPPPPTFTGVRGARRVSTSLSDVKEMSLRSMLQVLTSTTRVWSANDKDPLFWVAKLDADKPKPEDEALWVAEALRASLAYAPAGEKFNSHSLRAGAFTAAHAVGVPFHRILHVSGLEVAPRKDVEKLVDATAEPSEMGDFFFGQLRMNGYPLTEAQRALFNEDPARNRRQAAAEET